mmetsp:Transcript_22642/g.53466  ORF Transcript_22642/g.53466 Transcript_22642/m.53466 type:complete len:803 (+) Transcript_22642:228-2636(+)
MTKYQHLLPFLSFPLVLLLVGCAPRDTLADDGETITCLGGWAGDAQQHIPKAWINDGYCDCPFDGKDEPNTNACSGSSGWPGVGTVAARSAAESKEFSCPQQPNLVLPASKVHDGICDCCDGKDEEGRTDCADICDQVLKEEREQLAKLTNDYLVGSRKRDIDLVKFSEIRTIKIAQASKLDEQLNICNEEIQVIEGTKLVELKRQYVFSRMATMKDDVVSGSMAAELLTGMENSELEELIVHLCQVSGEIAKADGTVTGESTCSALRVAAMDLGLSWNDEEDFENYETTMNGKVNMTRQMIQTIFDNAMHADSEDGSPGLPSLRWKASSRSENGRRRLDEILDDDYHPVDDDYVHTDDEFRSEDHRRHSDRDRHENDDEQRDNEPTEKEIEFMDEIKTSLFSKSRANFLTQSEEILGEISKVLDDPSSESIETDADGQETQSESESESPPDVKDIVDPAAYTMVRNKLREKQNAIRIGFRWGASAKLLFAFSSLRNSNENLKRLVVGTIFYGQISAVQLWQILQVVLPEYKSLFRSEEENTCASLWANHCPPQRITRKEGEYPPTYILDAAKSFCDEEALKFGQDGSSASACTKDLNALVASSDNSLGYDVPTRRDPENDPFQSMFAPIISLPIDAEGLRSLEDQKKTKETEQRELRESINKIWKEVGGEDGTALGRDGELHAIANECFEIVAGKYTYELCLFGRAQQKEGSNKSGTNLGDFTRLEYTDSKDSPDTTSTRTLKWENGAQCWNGPKRSATVYMKCGMDHKIISADEPDTCRYVFEMETYLACDEDYKVRMGL